MKDHVFPMMTRHVSQEKRFYRLVQYFTTSKDILWSSLCSLRTEGREDIMEQKLPSIHTNIRRVSLYWVGGIPFLGFRRQSIIYKQIG